MKRAGIFLLALTAAVAAHTALFAARIYTWTDAEGTIHITDRAPPPGVTVEDVVADDRPGIEKIDTPSPQAASGSDVVDRTRAIGVDGSVSKLDAAREAYENAAAAVEAERAKYSYSAQRRRASRQSVVELEERAKEAFAQYRRILEAAGDVLGTQGERKAPDNTP